MARMGIKAIENFDAAFELSDECRDALTAFLSSEAFCKQVMRHMNASQLCVSRLLCMGFCVAAVPR